MKIIKRFEIEDGNGNIYMIRYSIGNHIKLHKFLRQDKDCMHDHPWAFLSIILKGSYFEVTPKSKDEIMWTKARKYSAPCILYRPAKWIHKIDVFEPCWSLVINFKKVKSWGFFTKKGFMPWRKYIDTARGKSICE